MVIHGFSQISSITELNEEEDDCGCASFWVKTFDQHTVCPRGRDCRLADRVPKICATNSSNWMQKDQKNFMPQLCLQGIAICACYRNPLSLLSYGRPDVALTCTQSVFPVYSQYSKCACAHLSRSQSRLHCAAGLSIAVIRASSDVSSSWLQIAGLWVKFWRALSRRPTDSIWRSNLLQSDTHSAFAHYDLLNLGK